MVKVYSYDPTKGRKDWLSRDDLVQGLAKEEDIPTKVSELDNTARQPQWGTYP